MHIKPVKAASPCVKFPVNSHSVAFIVNNIGRSHISCPCIIAFYNHSLHIFLKTVFNFFNMTFIRKHIYFFTFSNGFGNFHKSFLGISAVIRPAALSHGPYHNTAVMGFKFTGHTVIFYYTIVHYL